jgi:hypothetical protein
MDRKNGSITKRYGFNIKREVVQKTTRPEGKEERVLRGGMDRNQTNEKRRYREYSTVAFLSV